MGCFYFVHRFFTITGSVGMISQFGEQCFCHNHIGFIVFHHKNFFQVLSVFCNGVTGNNRAAGTVI